MQQDTFKMQIISQMIFSVQLPTFIRQTAKLVYFCCPALEPKNFTSLLPTLFKAIYENHKIFCGGGGGGGVYSCQVE